MNVRISISSAKPRPTLYRVKHDIEIGSIWRKGMPEVHPLFPKHLSLFQRWAQLVSFGLNPWFTPERWTDIYHWTYWISNEQGFGKPGDPRANFIEGKDTNEELPRVSSLVCGGSVVSGERMGDWIRINGLHYNDPVSLEYVKEHPEYWIRGVYAGGTGQPFRMLGDKYQGPALIHPLIINKDKGDLLIEAFKLQEWTSEELPDPLCLYL